MSGADHRTVGELLADSDELARETLLDATSDQASAMVRSWSLLVGSAAELWAGLAFRAGQPVGVGSDGAVAGGRGGDRPQRHRRTLARAGADRRTPDADRRQPLPRAAAGRTARPPIPASGPGYAARYPRCFRAR